MEMEKVNKAEKEILESVKQVFKSGNSDFKFYQKLFNEMFAYGITNNEKVLYRGVAEMAGQLNEYYWSHKTD